jgi:5-methylcytosine-specific restriction enzyme subunit McrC
MNRILYQYFHEVNQDNQFLKGRLDVNGYIKNNIANGNWQRITCDYDTFDIDNSFNRIIKYVSKILLAHTSNEESQRMLNEIVFLLDDVEDARMTNDDCEKVQLNPFFEELNTVLNYCKLFLSNSMIYSYKDEFELFAFLLPMEKIFEEFVVGFLEKNRKDLDIRAQKQDRYLASTKDSGVFQLIPDIFIQNNVNDSNNIIIDTKYKILDQNTDSKKGVSQADMYQVLSYAIRYDVRNIILLYPASISDLQESPSKENKGSAFASFVVRDELSNNKEEVQIEVYKLPMILYSYCDDFQILKEQLDHTILNATKNMIKTRRTLPPTHIPQSQRPKVPATATV